MLFMEICIILNEVTEKSGGALCPKAFILFPDD